jgi:DNA-binding transcriptional regulator YiaG
MSMTLTTETSIPDALRAGREQLGGGDPKRFPQPRMADLLGVSLRQYQRWERGASRPSARAVERIKRALAQDQEQSRDDTASIVLQVESLQTEIRALRAELDALRAARV